MNKIYLLIIILIALAIKTAAAETADIIVAQDGSGDFTNIQEAINSVPSNNSELKIILIKNGVYNEEIRIDTDYIGLVGEDLDSTRIEYYKPYDSYTGDVGRARRMFTRLVLRKMIMDVPLQTIPVFLYKKYNWARYTLAILSSMLVLGGIIGILFIDMDWMNPSDAL